MCGIAGIFAYRASAAAADRDELRRMRDYMERRGPDGSGEWSSTDRRLLLGHRRLSIIDLSDRASQPMVSTDGRLVVSFNGEIYNYHELRDELIERGRVFRTTSDTEVILELYAELGEGLVERMRGMFAFALWDARERSLLLARDPYGIKPLYYADTGGTLRFASQVKALLAGGGIAGDVDPAAQVGFLLFGSVPEPWTWRRAVRALPAGHVMQWREDRAGQPRAFFSLAGAWANAVRSARALDRPALQEEARAALLDSVVHHQVADVPVAAFLSAGLDSGALLGLMAEGSQAPIEAVTLAFDQFAGRLEDETLLAEEVARHYGARHTKRLVTHDEFESDLPAILQAMDQPSIDGINTWFVSKAAHEIGLKVAVSGVGGDELLGGYPSFRDMPRWERWLRVPSRIPVLPRAFRHAVRSLQSHVPRIHPKLSALLEYGNGYPGAYFLRRGLFMPWELDELLPVDVLRAGLAELRPIDYVATALLPDPESSFARVAALEASLYMRNQLLRDTDWASMAWSLEVRLPLVDSTMLAKLAPLLVSGDDRKALLVSAPRPALPRSVAARPKTGFGIPIAPWIGRSPVLYRWRDIPCLAQPTCHWSRRFAYELLASNIEPG